MYMCKFMRVTVHTRMLEDKSDSACQSETASSFAMLDWVWQAGTYIFPLAMMHLKFIRSA